MILSRKWKINVPKDALVNIMNVSFPNTVSEFQGSYYLHTRISLTAISFGMGILAI